VRPLTGIPAVELPSEIRPAVCYSKGIGQPTYASLQKWKFIQVVGLLPKTYPYSFKYDLDRDYLQLLRAVDYRVPDNFAPSERNLHLEIDRLKEVDYPQKDFSDVDHDHVFMAAQWTVQHLCAAIPVADRRPLSSLEEARDMFLLTEPKSRGGSPGYRAKASGLTTKAEAYSDPVEFARCLAYDQSLSTNEPIDAIWEFNLKDEILKRAKIDNRETRLYKVAPNEHHLSCYKLFAPFSKAIAEQDHDHFFTVGMPFEYGGWNQIMNKRRLPYSYNLCSDAKGYDISICNFLFAYACYVMQQLIPGHDLEIWNLFCAAVHTLVVTGGGDLLYTHTGNPSGWYDTTH